MIEIKINNSTTNTTSYPHSPPNTPLKLKIHNEINNSNSNNCGDDSYYEEESDIAIQNRLFLNPNYQQHVPTTNRSRSITISGSPTPRMSTANQRYSDDTVLLKTSNGINNGGSNVTTATTLTGSSYSPSLSGGSFSPISVTPTASPLNTPNHNNHQLTLSPFSIQKRAVTIQLSAGDQTNSSSLLPTPPTTPPTPQQKVFSPPRRRNTCANLTNKLYSVYSPHKSSPNNNNYLPNQIDNINLHSPISISSQKYLSNHHHQQSVSLSDYLCNTTSEELSTTTNTTNTKSTCTTITVNNNNLHKIKSKLSIERYKHYSNIFSAYNESYKTFKDGGMSVLNGEILVSIFQYLEVKDICYLALTCSWWRIVSEQNVLWLKKFHSRFQRPKTIIDRFSPSESWKELYIQHYFLDTSYMEFERLLSLFPVTVEYEHDITILLSKVLNYLKHTECRSEYIDKLEHLKNIHISFGNKVEAANCYIQHSELISWDSNQYFQQEFGYPKESHSDRKERILKSALSLLFESKYWERCLVIINQLRKKFKKDLKKYHSSNIGSGNTNISTPSSSISNSTTSTPTISAISSVCSIKNTLVLKMIEISRLEYQCFHSIENKDRFFEEYFFVEFRGKGFPKSVDGKDFIFRGKELEKLGSFVSRLKNRYPGAQVIPKQQGVDLSNSGGQFIHIRPCKPVLLPKEINSSIVFTSSSSTSKNYKSLNSFINNNSKVFFYSAPFKKNDNNNNNGKDGAVVEQQNEFLTLWTRNTFIISRSIFPSLIRNSLINEIVEIEKNPLENAVESLSKKNKELDSLFQQCKKQMQWTNHLTMSLNGVVDAVVSGGINMYRMFFNQSYINQNSSHHSLLLRLKQLLQDQKQLLEFGLDIHSHYCPENMKALQNNMELCFERWKQILSELIIPSQPIDNTQSQKDIYENHVMLLSRSHSNLESILSNLNENGSGSSCTTPTKQQSSSSPSSPSSSTINQIQSQLNQNQIEQLLKLHEKTKEKEKLEKEKRKQAEKQREIENLALLTSSELEDTINENLSFEFNKQVITKPTTSSKPPIVVKSFNSITTPIKQQPSLNSKSNISISSTIASTSTTTSTTVATTTNTITTIQRPASSLSTSSPALHNLAPATHTSPPQQKSKVFNSPLQQKPKPVSTIDKINSSIQQNGTKPTPTTTTTTKPISTPTKSTSSTNFLRPPTPTRPSSISRSLTTLSTAPIQKPTPTSASTSTTASRLFSVNSTPTKQKPSYISSSTFATPKKESLPIPVTTPVSIKKQPSSLSSSVTSSTTTSSSTTSSSFTRPTQSTLARKLEVETKKSTTLRLKTKERPSIIEPKTPQAKKPMITGTGSTTTTSTNIGSGSGISTKKSIYDIDQYSLPSPTTSSSSYSSSSSKGSIGSVGSSKISSSPLTSSSGFVLNGSKINNSGSSKLSSSSAFSSTTSSSVKTKNIVNPSMPPPLSTISVNTNSVPPIDISKPMIEKSLQTPTSKKRLSITDSIKNLLNSSGGSNDDKKLKTSSLKTSTTSFTSSTSLHSSFNSTSISKKK